MTRPGEPRIAALALLLDRGVDAAPVAPDWRPAGYDSVSAQWILASTYAEIGRETGGRTIVEPLASRFPELFVHPAR